MAAPCPWCRHRDGSHAIPCLGGLVKTPAPPDHGGSTYSRALDGPRLNRQLALVRDTMQDGAWRTLAELAAATGERSEASLSARLRDLRKPENGEYKVDRRRRGEASRGVHEYRVRAGGPEHVSSVIDRVMSDLATKAEG